MFQEWKVNHNHSLSENFMKNRYLFTQELSFVMLHSICYFYN